MKKEQKSLTKENIEFFEYLPVEALADYLPTLYSFESVDFGNWTIRELIDLIKNEIEKRRKK